MASIRKRPLGSKLGATQYTATIYDDGSGDAIVSGNKDMTGIDYVYIETNFESYNGFKLVESTGYGPMIFKIRDSPISAGDSPVQFVQDADAVFYVSVLDHGWQAVHLPIVYQIQSELYPTNGPEENTTHKTISSFSNVNGYTQINASAALNAPEALEFIEIVGTGDLAGKYQIISVVASDSIVIDLAYDAGYSFTGYHVLKYYNNYFITVNVYSGLEAGHRWDSVKPMRQVATLRLIPDSDNIVMFSISEILKGDIKTRNNLTLDTLPNNLDFTTDFKIGFFETWDEAVSGKIVSEGTTESVDSFVGHAVNSMMPFKSLNEGFMSDYLKSEDSPARWLTTLDRPVAVVGHFFDLSFIFQFDESAIDTGSGVDVTFFKQLNGLVTSTEIIDMPVMGTGVIRVPFIPESGYDLYCIAVSLRGSTDNMNLSLYANTGSGVDWTTGAVPYVNLSSPLSNISKILYVNRPYDVMGAEYNISASVGFTSAGLSFTVSLGVYTSGMTLLISQLSSFSGTGNGVVSLSFAAEPSYQRIGIIVSKTPGSTVELELHSVVITRLGTNITEQICVDIIEECGNTFTNDNLRITENGYFRELE